jgi:prolyl-tRNA editing enzyme YbaK/EbsC (Cys-tRNA(Pro) deacylase)
MEIEYIECNHPKQPESDTSLYDNEKIIFNAGRISSIAMKSSDYKLLVQPVVGDIV